ncbi:hypothetical protein NE237_018253 [Protea cynaroides]|uniref:Uncharacterized protein n=1 Tax=Protea cynaroides TaxID=273540 RepID=A0A9Q0QP02_9MAGN|nr:hypothetical protein NE237_018253 [Protea cynaroides]
MAVLFSINVRSSQSVISDLISEELPPTKDCWKVLISSQFKISFTPIRILRRPALRLPVLTKETALHLPNSMTVFLSLHQGQRASLGFALPKVPYQYLYG